MSMFDSNYPGADEDRKRHEDRRVAQLEAQVRNLQAENQRLRDIRDRDVKWYVDELERLRAAATRDQAELQRVSKELESYRYHRR